MKLHLVKPDLIYYTQYNDMMAEWNESGTQIAPWFLGQPFEKIEDFADFVQILDAYEHANQPKEFCSTTSYFVLDENQRLIGAASLRHYLTVKGLEAWGHIGYGVRPDERKKGYGTQILQLMLTEAKRTHMYKILIGAHTSNVASCRVIEKCGGKLENIVNDPDNVHETVSRYWIETMPGKEES